jgi:hypothetical protein
VNIIEQLRAESLKAVFALKAFDAGWPERRALINSFFAKPGHPSKQELIELGGKLSAVFEARPEATAVEEKSRGQSELSNAGTVWEALVVWYLNLCLAGTHAVCLRGGKLCPPPFIDALSVLFEASVLRSETDVALISLPGAIAIPRSEDRGAMMAAVADYVARNFRQCGLLNLQCKTNWKDNAQVPMLWNMLYNQARKGAIIANGFTIGRNGWNLRNLGHFGYGFVTVPTGDAAPSYHPGRLEVLRVKTMTAGNYWGLPSKQGVSNSLGEIFSYFNRNPAVFPDAVNIGTGIEAGEVDGVLVDREIFRLMEQ